MSCGIHLRAISQEMLKRERDIKFISLFGDRGHRGPYSPYKPYNHNLYIVIIIFPHIDNPQFRKCSRSQSLIGVRKILIHLSKIPGTSPRGQWVNLIKTVIHCSLGTPCHPPSLPSVQIDTCCLIGTNADLNKCGLTIILDTWKCIFLEISLAFNPRCPIDNTSSAPVQVIAWSQKDLSASSIYEYRS